MHTLPFISTIEPMDTQATAKPQEGMRLRLARQILYFHVALVAISFVLYLARGFDMEELTALMGMLAPVTAIYAGAVFKFLGGSLTQPEPIREEPNAQASSTVKVLIYGHFLGMLALITTKAFAPNVLNFAEMTMALTLLESVLGVYMGSLLSSLFK
jgi:hypothetical protein